MQRRRSFLRESLGCVAFMSGMSGLQAEISAADETDRGRVKWRAATPAAIRRGLDYLTRLQNEDGSFGTGNFSRNVGVCSLVGLAFMATGSVPGRGPDGRVVDRVLEFLLSCSQESGFLTYASATSHGPMYEHGFGTLLLAEAYGVSQQPRLRAKLAAAVRLIVDKQNSEGGWRYQPERRDADLSVTICQIMALRAARNAGLYVPTETVNRCVDYVKRCQNTDGGFAYTLAAGGPSKFPRSAAGLVALHSAGIYEGPEIERGREYVQRFLPGKVAANSEAYYFYGHYYAIQVAWQAGGEMWSKWYPAIEQELLGSQRDDGSWADTTSPVYGTAMACIVLQMPRNHLPIFQK